MGKKKKKVYGKNGMKLEMKRSDKDMVHAWILLYYLQARFVGSIIYYQSELSSG